MKTAGIIAEYNPFHLGHSRQVRLTREILGEDTAITAVMSGNYVQRGLPARWDKFARARAAVAAGVDLVLELPLTRVLCSAEGFARGGVEILSRIGIVDILSFGAECGDAALLMDLAKRMDSPSFDATLREGLDRGLPYAAARQTALNDYSGVLTAPNNILGLEYCRALLELKSHLTPLAVTRTGNYHATVADPQAPSATAVRKLHPDGPWQDYMPPESGTVLDGAPWYDLSYGERAVLARLRSLTDEQWTQTAHGSEGLWSKAMKAARSQPDWTAIIEATKSKRYPLTRIQRLFLCAYLGIRQQDLALPLPYVRVLAASETGRKLLRQAKKAGGLPLINPGQTPPDRDYYALETRAADLYTLFAAPGFPAPCRTEQEARWR